MAEHSSETNEGNGKKKENLKNPALPELPPASKAEKSAGFGSVAKERTPPPPEKLSANTDQDKLKLAASDILEFEIPIEQAASLHKIDPDKLRQWHSHYLESMEKTGLATSAQDNVKPEPRDTPIAQAPTVSRFTNWILNTGVKIRLKFWPITCVIGVCLLLFKLTRDNHDSPVVVAGNRVAENEVVSLEQAELDAQETNQQDELLRRVAPWLQHLVNCETWQERLRYVRHPKRVKPLMEDYYKRNGDGPINPITIEPQASFIQRSDGKFALAKGWKERPGAAPKPLVFLIEISADDTAFRVDWEMLVNYQPKPWKEFKSTRSPKAFPFRARVSRDDYYNGQFMDSEKYVCFRLRLLDREDESLYGFAKTGSAQAIAIEKSLSRRHSGNRSMILQLRYPQDSKFDNLVEIDRIIADKW